jgi:ribosomal RNA-processing protein 12
VFKKNRVKMGNFRARTKPGKNHARWRKGHSSSSNPSKSKHRDAAKSRLLKVGFGGHLSSTLEAETPRSFANGPARLTAESLLRHDALLGNVDQQQQGAAADNEDNDAMTLGQTHKTFDTFAGSVWSECSNVSFARLLPRFNPGNTRHKEMLAILSAIAEVIKENKIEDETEEASPVEYFGALLTSLDVSDTTDSLSATVALLSIVIKTIDKELLKSKFSVSSKLLLELLSRHGQTADASVVRGLLGCLSVLLRAQDKSAWSNQSTVRIMDSILSFVADPRPKVRKASQHAVCAVMASKSDSDDFHPSAVHVAKFLVSQIEASDVKAVLHILVLLKEILYMLPKQQVKITCETILKVMTLGNAYTLSCGFQALHGLFAGRPSAKSLPGDMNARLIAATYDFQPSINDGQPLVAWLTVQQEAHINLSEQDPRLCLANLQKFFANVTRCWASDRSDIIAASTTALKAVLNEAVKPHMDVFSSDKECLEQIKTIFSHIEEGLSYQFQSAWAQVRFLVPS